MMCRLVIAVALIFLCGSTALAAGDYRGLQRLGGSMVTWNDDRLTAELKSAPVKGVLKDLIAGEGFACQVTGDLQGTVSMTIDNLTVEETIQKIMRNRRYDYTLILAEPISTQGGAASVNRLTIYQGSETIRFERLPQGASAVQPERVQPATPLPADQATDQKPVRRTDAAAEEMRETLDTEIKTILDNMLSEGKMTQQEYDQALQTFSEEDR